MSKCFVNSWDMGTKAHSVCVEAPSLSVPSAIVL
jgi:hypothetical protein